MSFERNLSLSQSELWLWSLGHPSVRPWGRAHKGCQPRRPALHPGRQPVPRGMRHHGQGGSDAEGTDEGKPGEKQSHEDSPWQLRLSYLPWTVVASLGASGTRPRGKESGHGKADRSMSTEDSPCGTPRTTSHAGSSALLGPPQKARPGADFPPAEDNLTTLHTLE